MYQEELVLLARRVMDDGEPFFTRHGKGWRTLVDGRPALVQTWGARKIQIDWPVRGGAYTQYEFYDRDLYDELEGLE